ncbi:MAG: hypothetical protein LBC63_08095 [Holophagales bacterium]|jgi:hypothetical protein|nr:hypothetical protein [Holophagales bacterium]
MSFYGICLVLLLVYLVVAPINCIVRFFIRLCSNDPELDMEIRREKYIDKRMREMGYSIDSRHHSHIYAECADEYDAIVRAAQKDALDGAARQAANPLH